MHNDSHSWKAVIFALSHSSMALARLLLSVASYPGSLIMWGRKREPGDYCVVHAPNVDANLPGYVVRFTLYDDL